MEVDDAIDIIEELYASEKIDGDIEQVKEFFFDRMGYGASVETALDLTYQEWGI